MLVESLMSEPTPMEELPSRLFRHINSSGVRYCNWKSSIRIEEGLRGKTDLDLLVDPQDAEIFRRILQTWGVKVVRPAPGKDYPGIENFLGFDASTGSMFHLHVHYQLVLGEQFVKNYQLPLEKAFLGETILRHGVKAPMPDLELIVLCLRVLLKSRDRDVIKDRFPILQRVSRSAGLPKDLVKEIHWLLAQTSLEQVATRLDNLIEQLPTEAILGILKMITTNGENGQLWHYREQVRQGLHKYQRRNRFSASINYFREDWRRKRRIFKPLREKKMTLANPGPRVALIGVDGAGKSTLALRIDQWLSWRLNARVYYMGKINKSLPKRMIKPLVKFSRNIHSRSLRYFQPASLPARITEGLKDLLEDLAAIMDGQSRLKVYRDSCLNADGGTFVLYDRYPLEFVQVEDHQIDGPRIARKGNDKNSWRAWLARIEESYYRQIQPPDHVILLLISPELSRLRKPGELGKTITLSPKAVDMLGSGAPGLTVVSADQPLDDELALIKPVLWNLL